MTAGGFFSEKTISERTPQHFFSPSRTSLGHLHVGEIPVRCSIARATATPAYSEMMPMCCTEILGRRISENVRFLPGSDDHVLPSLPRPAICWSAMTMVPSVAPSSANVFALILVESRTSYVWIVCPNE